MQIVPYQPLFPLQEKIIRIRKKRGGVKYTSDNPKMKVVVQDGHPKEVPYDPREKKKRAKGAKKAVKAKKSKQAAISRKAQLTKAKGGATF